MAAIILEDYVTMEDILAEVPVSARTIRNWISLGLMPHPERTSEGYGCGVKGYYPSTAIDIARVLHAAQCLTLKERKRLVSKDSKYKYRVEEDGTIVLTIHARRV